MPHSFFLDPALSLPPPLWGRRRNELTLLEWQEQQVLHSALLHHHGTPAMHALALRLHYRLSWDVTFDWCDATSHHPRNIDKDVDRAFNEHGQIPGMCALANIFQKGLVGVSFNHDFALFLLTTDVSAYDCHLARYRLAEAYGSANFYFATVLYEYLFLHTGLAAAALGLGRMLDYQTMDGRADWRRAAALFEYAVQTADSTHALRKLGNIFWYGRPGLPENPVKCVEIYEKYETTSTKPICSKAMTRLARQYAQGSFAIPQSTRRAVELYEKSIRLDPQNMKALTGLGSLLEQGADDVPADPRRAEECYTKAAEDGYSYAKLLLATLLMNGYAGLLPDKFRVQNLCEELMQDGIHSQADMRNIAILLDWIDDDLGLTRRKAAEYLQKSLAIDSGSANKAEELRFFASLLLKRGAGLNADRPRAIRLLERAVSHPGNFSAMRSLAILLSDRRYDEDVPRAIALLESAIEGGEEEATILLADLLTEVRYSSPIDRDRGIALFNEQVEMHNHMAALVGLAIIYGIQNDETSANVPKAIELCERAIAQGLNNDSDELHRLGITATEDLSNDRTNSPIRTMNTDMGLHLIGMCALASILLRRSPPRRADMERALSLYERALKDPKASSLFQVEPTGDEWLLESRMIGDQVYFDSLRRLFTHVREDRDLSQKAVRVYELAVGRTGSTKTMCLLGEIFLNGATGVPQDLKKSRCYYKRAIFKGDTCAMLTYGDLVSSGGEEFWEDREYATELLIRIIDTEDGGVIWRSAIVSLAMLFQNRRRLRNRVGLG